MDLSLILSSQARFKILHSLSRFELGLSLRNIEATTGLSIRSVQVAVDGLIKEKVLTKTKNKSRILFNLNNRHLAYDLLRDVFALIDKEELKRRAKSYSKRAQASLKFSEEMNQMIKSGQKV